MAEIWIGPGQFMDADEYRARKYATHGRAPMVITDSMPRALKHMATGEVTESKSAFRRMTKETGCVELGDQVPKPKGIPKPKERPHETLKRAWDQLSSR